MRGGPTFPREFCIRALLHGVSNLPSVLQCPLAGFRSYDVLLPDKSDHGWETYTSITRRNQRLPRTIRQPPKHDKTPSEP